MAARTTTGDGAVSNVTGTNLDGGTALGTTDTLTDTNVIHFDANTSFGSSPSTGGTAAFVESGGKTCTIDAGITVTMKGDCLGGDGSANKLALGAGSQLVITPASGQRYNFSSASLFDGNALRLDATGSSGSHAVLKTDTSGGGLPTLMFHGGDYIASFGVMNATYLDMSDFGSSSQLGIYTRPNSQDSSLTHCTFTRTNYRFGAHGSSTLTFQHNIFNSSVATTVGGEGIANICSFSVVTADISNNGFDGLIYIDTWHSTIAFYNNVVGPMGSLSGSFSSDDSYHDNVVYNSFATPNPLGIPGPARDCHMLCKDGLVNPHFFGNGGTDAIYTRLLFECPNQGGGDTGDGLFVASAGGNTGCVNCISIPGGGASGTNMISFDGTLSPATAYALHCTQIEGGELVNTGESSEVTYTGMVPQLKSNLVVSANIMADISDVGAGHRGTDTITVSDYNATWNAPTNGQIKYNSGGNTQTGVIGYNGMIISDATPVPNSRIAANDLLNTITSDPFVHQRTYIEWGEQIAGLPTPTGDDVFAWQVANPTAATDAVTGSRAWVMDGYKVTGANGLLIKDNGHDGVTRGAMGFQASGGGQLPLGGNSGFVSNFGGSSGFNRRFG